jgi:hypothetical protein
MADWLPPPSATLYTNDNWSMCMLHDFLSSQTYTAPLSLSNSFYVNQITFQGMLFRKSEKNSPTSFSKKKRKRKRKGRRRK